MSIRNYKYKSIDLLRAPMPHVLLLYYPSIFLGNMFIHLFFRFLPLSISPKGETYSYPFPHGGRLGRGYWIMRRRFEIVK
jgi:hypothetical protein